MITLAHGEGGRLSRQLIERILTTLGSAGLTDQDDAAKVLLDNNTLSASGLPPLAITTDSFVVSPLFFPGGDIGTLAVYGTINDLAVSGATPQYLTLSLILEEGLPLETLDQVISSVASAATAGDVSIVAGDTKVVPRGAADQLFINTTGVGTLDDSPPAGPHGICVGDELLVTGPIGQHGVAVLCEREGFQLHPKPVSDCASLAPVSQGLRRELGGRLHAMRDATRGGVAAVLHEWAASCGHTLTVEEAKLPVSAEVRGACELLGLDPLHVANEGTMLCAVAEGSGEAAVQVLRQFNQSAAVIGATRTQDIAPVTVQRMLGSEQPLDDPLGAPLPRIC